MRQIPLPLGSPDGGEQPRIVVGSANAAVIDAFARAGDWPFRTAVLVGPARSGKSLLANWFVSSGLGQAIDNAEGLDEHSLFHRWNRAQETAEPLLLVASGREAGWSIALPDLASRIGAALHLTIGALDDAMMTDLIALHAEKRGLVLGADAESYLASRAERSHLGVERLVAAIDRLTMERKLPPNRAILREALEEQARTKALRLP